MKQGKFANPSGKRNMKPVALLLALVLLVGAAVGGTVAWLMATTAPVTNTFTTSDVDITLTETDATDNKKSFQMIPGYTIEKDPTVTVLADSEKCYVFVKVEKANNFDTFMTYTMAEGWTQGDGTDIPDTVWYRVAEDTEANQTFAVINDNTVTVKDTVTKALMDGVTAGNEPKLTVTAYACQFNSGNTTKFEPAEAWAIIGNNGQTPTTTP